MPAAISCDPTALAEAACRYCFNEQQARQVITYLLAQIAGDTSTPAELAAKAKCYCFDHQTAEAVITYLLCQAATRGECVLPDAPSGLSAVAGNNQVALSWNPVVGAIAYSIKRSLVSGGPYTTIDNSLTNSYTDITALNGTTYYYVVSAINPCGESAVNSLESQATPLAEFSYEPPTAQISWTDMNGTFGPLDRATFFATADIPSVTDITLSDGTVTAVTSLSALPSLGHFTALFNAGLAALDFSGCTVLTSIIAPNNGLTTLNLSGCSALASVNCANNTLTTLDVSTCTSLSTLNCSNNLIAALSIAGLTALSSLDCHINSLTSLDVSNHAALLTLDCGRNSLTTLDVSNCTAMTSLACNENSLALLDISTLAGLTLFRCHSNSIASLNLTACTALIFFNCSSNQLTTLNISACTPLITFDCSSNTLTVLAVDTILSDLVSNGQTGGTVNCSNQTPAAPPDTGPPDGIAAKATLLGEVPAWTVTTD